MNNCIKRNAPCCTIVFPLVLIYLRQKKNSIVSAKIIKILINCDDIKFTDPKVFLFQINFRLLSITCLRTRYLPACNHFGIFSSNVISISGLAYKIQFFPYSKVCPRMNQDMIRSKTNISKLSPFTTEIYLSV